MRFVVQEDQAEQDYEVITSISAPIQGISCLKKPEGTKTYPSSISVASLLKAGKLVKPIERNKVTLTLENFDVLTQQWVDVGAEEFAIDTEKFSGGAVHDAFRASSVKQKKCKEWVVKTYNDDAIKTIQDTVNNSVENHCRKQVQMHSVARHITQRFKAKAPQEFGECFEYNNCYYTTHNGKPVTIEEYVPGSFYKLISNDRQFIDLNDDSFAHLEKLFLKAECLVHYSYVSTKEKLMILDIQGLGYTLYDPEISTALLVDGDREELYFCCENCSSIGIQAFIKSHKCKGLFKRSQQRPTLLDQQCWTMLALSVQTASTNNYVTMSINKMAPVFKFKVQK